MRLSKNGYKKSALNIALGVALAASAGTAYADHVTLTNADGWNYRFDPSESQVFNIENTGAALTDIIGGSAFRLYIDGSPFFGSGNTATLDGEGRLAGEDLLSGLTVTRETYVPSNANFIRQLSILSNPTAANIVVTVAVTGNTIDATPANITVPASSSGDAASGIDDVWLVINGDVGDAVLAHAFGSVGASEAVDVMTAVTGNNSFDYEWQNITVPAGDTVMFLQFSAGAADNAAAQTAAESMSALTNFSIMMNGIDAVDYNKIVNYSFADTDGDGMVDAYETVNGLNPAVDDSAGDLDGDGLSNIAEFNAGTLPNNVDTDGDGLSDGAEVNLHITNPLSADSDNDGISDGDEVTAGTDPNDGRDGPYLELSSAKGVHSPDVAVDSQGRMHVVWMQDVTMTDPLDPLLTYTDSNVMYKLLNADADILIDSTRLSDSFADANTNQGHPSITVDNNGHAYVSWFSSNTSDGFIVGIDPANTALDGSASTVATIQKFAPVTIANCKRSDLAVDSNGNIHMACADDNNNAINMAVIGADGSLSTPPYAVTNADNGGNYGVSRVSLALDAMNRGVIAFYDYTSSGDGGEMAYAMVDGVAGSTLTAATQLSTNGTADSVRHPSISLTAAGMAYMTWGDDTNGIQLAKFTPSLDDMNGDAASTVTIGYSQSTVAGANPFGWYVSSALGSDGELLVTYNSLEGATSTNGNGIAPRYFVKLDSSNAVTTAETGIDPTVDSDAGNDNTRTNYMGIASQDTNIVVYVTDGQARIKLARLDGGTFFVTTDPNAPEPTPAPAASSSDSGFLGLSISLWSLLGLPAFVGLLRLKRKK